MALDGLGGLRGLGSAAVATVRVGGGRSTTRRSLRLLRGWLLVATAAVGVTTFAAFTGTRDTLEVARTRTAPAAISAASTSETLVRANTQAVLSFGGETNWLGGRVDRYESEIGAAGQSLSQVGEHDEAGVGARREIQLVQGLLVSYRSWMEQADTRYGTDPESLAGAANLWYAAQLVHAEDGILAHLEALRGKELRALDRQLSSGWNDLAATFVWLVPLLSLGVLLVGTQLWYRRRFRRTVNPHLLAATGLLLGVLGLTALALPAQVRAHDAAGSLRAELVTWSGRAEANASADRRAVANLVTGSCSIHCPATVRDFASSPADTTVSAESREQQLASVGTAVDAAFTAALWPSWLRWLLVGACAGIAALVVTGLQQRVDEYRFRPTRERS